MKCGELMNMTRAWDKEKFGAPNRNRTHDLPNTGRELFPLSFSLSHARVMLINSPSLFITEIKIHHLYKFITTDDDFDSVDPSGMQDTCHIWTQLNDLALHEFS